MSSVPRTSRAGLDYQNLVVVTKFEVRVRVRRVSYFSAHMFTWTPARLHLRGAFSGLRKVHCLNLLLRVRFPPLETLLTQWSW
jgi:hypothetical protein